MATQAQKNAARKNIKKAQETWQSMSDRARARAMPEGDERAEPGEKGTGNFYRIVVRDEKQFTSFRTQDVGDPGGIERIAGHRKSGSWDTQAWLIEKDRAEVEGDTLKPLDDEVREVLEQLGSKPKHVKGDIFRARPRRNVPESEKPTKAQRQARQANIKKAQAARARAT